VDGAAAGVAVAVEEEGPAAVGEEAAEEEAGAMMRGFPT